MSEASHDDRIVLVSFCPDCNKRWDAREFKKDEDIPTFCEYRQCPECRRAFLQGESNDR